MIAQADLTKIERSVVIQAPRARVWGALASVAEFSSWFQVKAEGEFAPGARVRMTSTHPSCLGRVFYVTIENVAPERSFSWRWHPSAAQPPEGSSEPPTVVEFRLTDEDGATRVTVTESGFEGLALDRRAKAFRENDEGWKEQLAALDRYLSA